MNKKLDAKSIAELSSHSLFKDLSTETLQDMFANAYVKECSAGQYLARQGEECEYIYFVKKGALRGFIGEQTGDETIVNLFKKGDICCDESIFTTNIARFPYNLVTLKKTNLIVIHKYELTKHISKNSTFSNNLLYFIGYKNIKMQKHMEAILSKTPLERIGSYILENTKENTIDFQFNKSVIANYLGMSPETFSRNFSKLKEVFSITVENNRIKIQDPDAMCTFCNLDFVHKCSRRKEKQEPSQ